MKHLLARERAKDILMQMKNKGNMRKIRISGDNLILENLRYFDIFMRFSYVYLQVSLVNSK